MGLFSSSSKGGHNLPKGMSKGRAKGSQKGVRARDHQRGPLNLSGKNTRSYLFGAPKKWGW